MEYIAWIWHHGGGSGSDEGQEMSNNEFGGLCNKTSNITVL
jgi:hypothetical protein